MNSWLFGFPASQESAYRREIMAESLIPVRIVVGLIFILYLTYGLVSGSIIDHGKISISRDVYFGLAMPLAAAWFLATFLPFFKQRLPLLNAVGIVLCLQVARVFFKIIIPERTYLFEPASTVLITAAIYSVFRLPFLWAAGVGTVFSASSYALLEAAGGITDTRLALTGVFAATANVIGMTASYLLEKGWRIDFLRRKEVEAERERSENLLLNILPSDVAERLKAGEKTIADRKPETAVLFADIVGYTQLSEKISPDELVGMLDDVFSRFDDIVADCGLEKIKTIGDAYMAVAGVGKSEGMPAADAARAALKLTAEIERYNEAHGKDLRIRVGLHAGPLVAGVIGKHKFSYDLWGETVNIASRMESAGEPGRIQTSEAFAQSLKTLFDFEKRGEVDIKGKGRMTTYWLSAARR